MKATSEIPSMFRDKESVLNWLESYIYLSGEDWQFKGTERTDTEEEDLDIWCQEFDNKEAVDALRETMGNGNLYIAHFEKENGEEMEDILLISCKMRSSREEN